MIMDDRIMINFKICKYLINDLYAIMDGDQIKIGSNIIILDGDGYFTGIFENSLIL